MKESIYKNYDELPLFLNAATVAKVLGIAPSSSYELMHEKDFPALRIGNRIVVPKEAFIRWVEQHTGGAGGSAVSGRHAIRSRTTSRCRKKFSRWV
jgi:excisionase family DNA binding protein